MILYDLINTDELKKTYNDFKNGSYLNFAVYYNSLDINTFKVVSTQKDYLFNGDINFSNRKYSSYRATTTDTYSYNSEEIDNSSDVFIQSCLDGGIIADLDDDIVILDKNVISVYPYIWYEVVNGVEATFTVPNQGNWNIESYIDDNGDLILNTDNE